MSTRNELSDEQYRAVMAPGRVLQVVACAGSGKTEVLAHRIVRLLAEGVPPDEVVAFTFTEKAGTELKERVEERAAAADPAFDRDQNGLPPVARGLYVGTIHAYCWRLLQDHDERYGASDLLDEAMHWTLLWRFRKRLGLTASHWPTDPPFRNDAEVLASFVRSASVVYNDQIDEQVLAERSPQFARTLERYEALLDRMRLLTFDLVINRAIRELEAGGSLARRLQGHVQHVLVDEQQDLNPAQAALVHRLHCLGAAIMAVGDDDQAIYQWRGGDARLFVQFTEQYDGAQRFELQRNRRSVKPIVRGGNEVARAIGERVDKHMEEARNDEAAPLDVVQFGTQHEEATGIARMLREAHEEELPWAAIGVLLRSVRGGSRELLYALRNHGVPYQLVGTQNLLVRPELRFLASLIVWWSGKETWRPERYAKLERIDAQSLERELARLVDVDDSEAARRVEALWALGQDACKQNRLDIVRLLYNALQLSGLVVPGEPGDAGLEAAMGAFVRLLSSFSHAYLRAAPPADDDPLYTPEESETEPQTEEDPAIAVEPREDDDNERVVVFAPGQRVLVALKSFLETYGAEGEQTPPEEPEQGVDAVQIMTIHQAKGLEFPFVVVPRLTDRHFPVPHRPGSWMLPRELFSAERYEGTLDDERRLFYVAVTRARDRVVLTSFGRDGRGAKLRPSPFLKDLAALEPEGLLRASSRTSAEASRVRYRRTNERLPLVTTSFSELWDYADCPYRYRMRQEGFRPPLDPALGFGKVAHHVLSWVGRDARDEGTVDRRVLETRIQRNFYLPLAGGESQQALRHRLTQMLAKYVDDYGAELRRIRETERRFEVPLSGGRIIGRIDYLLRAKEAQEDAVEILEFKMQRRAPMASREQHQVRLYAEAVRREGLEPTVGTLHNLARDKRVPVDLRSPPPQVFLRELGDLISGIRRGRFPPTQNHETCARCDFARVCPHARVRPAPAAASSGKRL